MECLLPYLCMVTVLHIMVGLERMLNYRGVGLARFHCMYVYVHVYYRHTMVFAKELSCSALSEVLYSPGGCSEDVMLSRGEWSAERECVCCLPSINAVSRLSIDCGGPSEGFSPLWYCLQSYI